MTAETVLRAHPKCLLTEMPDGTGVVLNLETRFYYTLNATAVCLWKSLGASGAGLAEVARHIAERFEVDLASAERDVAALVPMMLDEGLAVRDAGAGR